MISILYPLVFPYIFPLFDCFVLALIDRIVKCNVHSVLWQFQRRGGGGVNLKFYPGKSEIYKAVYHFQLLLQSATGGGGVNLKFYPGKSENLSSRTFRCAHQ